MSGWGWFLALRVVSESHRLGMFSDWSAHETESPAADARAELKLTGSFSQHPPPDTQIQAREWYSCAWWFSGPAAWPWFL